MYCMHLPAVIVTSADITQLWVYLLPEAICCYLETCNVYVMLLTLFCILCVHTFMGTCANVSYIVIGTYMYIYM